MFEVRRRSATRWVDVPAEDRADPDRWVGVEDLDGWDEFAGWVASDAELEALICADPAGWPEPAVDRDPAGRTVGQVLADGEQAPMTVDLACALGRLAPAGLGDRDRVRLLVGLERAGAYFTARKMAAVASFARRDPVDSLDPANHAWAEVGAALRIGDGAASTLIYESRRLAHDLPGTRDALQRGDLTLAKARTMIDYAAGLTGAQRAELEAAVLSKAAGRTPKQHTAAVARAVARIAPDVLDARRRQQREDIRLVATHHGSGMGELFATMASEDLDLVWTGADAWARRAKAEGDRRPLDQLRVAALTRWAESFLTHGDPTSCDQSCPPAEPEPPADRTNTESSDTADTVDTGDAGASGVGAPRRHGRPITVNISIDLPSALGLTDGPGELLGSGALVPAGVVRDLLRHAQVRWLRTDPQTGRLLDISTNTYRPGARLAEFVAMRDVTATTPTGSFAPAAAQDLDHIRPHEQGGPTDPGNLHSPTRRWHIIKTKRIGWTVVANDDGSWTWTSALGRTYTVEPHDYRLGP
jgi:hypothetical protein